MFLPDEFKTTQSSEDFLPFGDFDLQDVFVLAVIYAARLNTASGCDEACRRDIQQIRNMLKDHPVFKECAGDPMTRINKFVNFQSARDLGDVVAKAVKKLDMENRLAVFESAQRILAHCESVNEISRDRNLEDLKQRLGIDSTGA